MAGGQADVGLGVAGPPGQDPGPVGGGVLDPVGDQAAEGVLAEAGRSPDPDTSSPSPLRGRQLSVAGDGPGGRCGGGGGSAGAGPGCRGRHSQGRRPAAASWAGSLGALRSRWALALQEAGGAAAATAGGLGQGAGRPGLAVRPRLGIGRLQPRPDRGGVGGLGPAGSARRWEPSAAAAVSGLAVGSVRRTVVACGSWSGWLSAPARSRSAAWAARRVTSPASPLSPSSMASTARGMAAAIGLGDQVGLGVGDVAADRGGGAAADQQPAVAGALGAAAGAADDAEHAVDGRPVGHHRDGGGLPPAVAGLDPQGVQAGRRHRIGAQGDHHGDGHPQLQGDPVQPGHRSGQPTLGVGRRGRRVWPSVRTPPAPLPRGSGRSAFTAVLPLGRLPLKIALEVIDECAGHGPGRG